MAEGEDDQESFLKKAEVYNLITEQRFEEIALMGDEAVPALVSILKNGEGWKKAVAVGVLANIDGISSVRALKLAAQDPESGIRRLAANALANKEGKTAEKIIEKMKEDPSRHVVMEAERILLRRSSAPPPPANGNSGRVKRRSALVRS
ncbi:MAG: HEAT repeat domain-containing protein [Candidatus Bilamarchaeaceae archaeon]